MAWKWKWQKVVLVSLPPLFMSGGIWGIWKAMSGGGEEAAATSAGSVTVQEAATPETEPEQQAPQASADPVAPATSGLREKTPATGEPEKAEEQAGETGAEEPKDSGYYAALFRKEAADLSQDKLWQAFVAHPRNLEILVKAVEQMANGSRPLVLAELGFLPVPGAFKAVPSGGAWIMSPETESRFSPVVTALCGVDPRKLSTLLKTMEPELDRILHETYKYPPENTFRNLLFECMKEVLETPLPESAPRLVRITSRLYRFENPELEGLGAGQKFILRLGPVNQGKLQTYLRTLWQAL